MIELRTDAAGVRKAPRHEIAVEHVTAVPRALWGLAPTTNLRFLMRIDDPLKQWKLSPMDLESRRRWELYTKAKETMLERTHIPEAPWWVVEADDKKRARLNCIAHLLTRIPYQEVPYEKPILPKRAHSPDYHRTPVPKEMYVPDHYANLSNVVSRPSAFPRRRRRSAGGPRVTGGSMVN